MLKLEKTRHSRKTYLTVKSDSPKNGEITVIPKLNIRKIFFQSL